MTINSIDDKLRKTLLKHSGAHTQENSQNLKAGLKLNIQKAKIMASRPITLWQIDGGKVEIVIVLFSWAPKSLWIVTAVMKLRHLLLEKKAMTNLESVFKSRGSTLPTKLCVVKAMAFLIVIYARVGS